MNHHYVEDWVDWLTNVRQLRAATIGAYEETMNAFVLWLVTADMVNDALSTTWETVTPEQIEQFMGRHRRCGVGKPATQDRDNFRRPPRAARAARAPASSGGAGAGRKRCPC